MCKLPRLPMGTQQLDTLLRRAAALVAVRSGLDESALRTAVRARVPWLFFAWRPQLGMSATRFVRRRLAFVVRESADRLARRARYHAPASVEAPARDRGRTVWSTASDAADALENRVLVKQLLASASDRERRVLALRFRAGVSNEEIASVLGVSVRTVERDVSIAIKRMRKMAERVPPR